MNYNPKLSTVEVENLRLRAYIGFLEWEKEKLQDLVISFSFKYDTADASRTDDVKYAINYKSITKSIIKMVDNQSFNLLETLSENVYDFIQNFEETIQDITVKVEKPNALRFTDNVMVKISSQDRYNRVIITMGSNINPEENFTKALPLLQSFGTIVQRTNYIQTPALKFKEQPDFLNGALLFYTQKSLSALRFELKQVEAQLGRVRSENKSAPRTIDLDITAFNGFLIDKDLDELPFIKDFIKQLQPEISL